MMNIKMSIKDFANKLDGREYGQEIFGIEKQLAKELGFVVVFGASDDLAEFEGAIGDEASCYEGDKIYLDKDGIFEECDCGCKYSEAAREKTKVIKTIWGEGEYSWQYETDIPYETFEIFDDGKKYCKGIVFDIKSLN